MSDFTTINSINLGTTFGAWYAKTNEMITRLNALKVGGITGGDGILVTPHPTTQGGYTLDIGSTISKNVTFNGNVTVNGTLTSSFTSDVSGINVVLPANSGVTIGNIVYLDSTGKIEKALADDECTSEVVGIVIGFTGGNAQVATAGRITGSTVVSNFLGAGGATLQKGVVYFLSGGVSGAGTTLEPDVTSYVSKPMLLGLTGDTGLILPYRGFIGLTASNTNNSTVQATTGVLSLNGITAALWPSTGPRTSSRLLTTGHLHAINYLDAPGFIGAPKLTKNLKLDIESISRSQLLVPAVNTSGGINVAANIRYVLPNGNETDLLSIFSNNIDDGFIFTTDVTISDVYKITSIKIVPRVGAQNAPSSFTFSLQKQYNSIAGTTLISITTSFIPGSNMNLIQNSPYSNSRIELRKKGYAIAGQLTDITLGTQVPQYSSETSTSEIIKPVINSYGFTLANYATLTYGLTGGTIDGIPDTSGSFPIVYPSLNGKCRPQAFTINNVTLSGTNVSKYIQSNITNFPFFGTTDNGYTMESAILGWNAQYGAVVESLYFVPTSVISLLPDDGELQCDIILEIYKYNPTTQTTTAGPLYISTKYTITTQSARYSGTLANPAL